MLLTDEDVQQRLESPLNLLNRLREASTSKRTLIPSIPDVKDIVPDIEKKLEFVTVRKKATDIMQKCMNRLDNAVEEIDNPKQLATIAADMGKVIASTKDDSEREKFTPPQVIIYCPTQMSEDEFAVVDVRKRETA